MANKFSELRSRMSPQAQAQAVRTAQLQGFAAEVFGTHEQGNKWLHKPNPSLDGIAPLDYAYNESRARRFAECWPVSNMAVWCDPGLLEQINTLFN